MTGRRLLLIELNELNFNVVGEYIEAGYSLPNFSRLLKFENRVTTSESQYHLLEPWIQWVSVHSGKTFDEHNVFRLGDAVLKKPEQLFELLESRGVRVGAISPMNALNALASPAYFVPDPWTDTPSDGSILSRMLTTAIRQTVNDNSEGKITVKSKFFLAVCLLFLVRPTSYLKLIRKLLGSRGRSWQKALFLDRFLHEIHITLLRRSKPHFSTIFFNAGAHIQHHYFLNSISSLATEKTNPDWYVDRMEDPFADMLTEYDDIIGELLDQDKWEIIVATGLTQRPVERSVF